MSGCGNPCTSPAVDAYLTFTTEEQKRVGVTAKQAAPLLEDTLVDLLPHMRVRALASGSAAERITITRDIALFALAHHTTRRRFDLSFTMGSQVLRLPESRGFLFNFLFGKTLAVVVRSGANQDTSAVRAVAEYIDAAQAVGWDLSTGYLFPPVLADGSRAGPQTSRHPS